jgi:hypothetical protein
LASAPGHPFYQRLNKLLEAERFDEFVEGRCAKFYAEKNGRPSLTPGIYFRAVLIGYFEGIGGERGIAWRLADSLALRGFASVITSKAANGYHFKTGQRDWPSGTENVLPYRLLWWQVGFGAPASRAALEHVTVVQ